MGFLTPKPCLLVSLPLLNIQVYFNGNVSWHAPIDTPLVYHAPLAVRTVDVG
jgi:hypothetical protein